MKKLLSVILLTLLLLCGCSKEEAPQNIRFLTKEEESQLEVECQEALARFSIWEDDMQVSVNTGWNYVNGVKTLTQIDLFISSLSSFAECETYSSVATPILQTAYSGEENIYIHFVNLDFVFVNGHYDENYVIDYEYHSPFENPTD